MKFHSLWLFVLVLLFSGCSYIPSLFKPATVNLGWVITDGAGARAVDIGTGKDAPSGVPAGWRVVDKLPDDATMDPMYSGDILLCVSTLKVKYHPAIDLQKKRVKTVRLTGYYVVSPAAWDRMNTKKLSAPVLPPLPAPILDPIKPVVQEQPKNAASK